MQIVLEWGYTKRQHRLLMREKLLKLLSSKGT